jgi:CheY-like chemotaxis protein
MRPTGRILIVDDDPLFLAAYRDLLALEGYTVETAEGREQALTRLDERDWDVVLLDQKLLGREGPDLGIEMVAEVKTRAPRAKAIIVTAYASGESIERAFDAGVYDFLIKNEAFSHLLRAKVRNALEAVRERNFGRMAPRETEEQIQSTWRALQNEQDRNRKGLLLEELMELLFRSIDGFQLVDRPKRRNQDEEIDLVIQTDPRHASFWARESPYILVECKNWSRPVGPEPFDRFQSKLERRFDRTRLGFFVASGGFTAGFHSTRQTERRGNVLVVCMGPEDLAALVAAGDRDAVLKQFHARDVMGANGSH